MYKFVLNIFYLFLYSFLPAKVAVNSIERIIVLPVGLYFRLVCTSGWFVLPVGLCEWKITTARPILTISLGTF